MGFSDWAAETASRFRDQSPRFAAKRSGQELLTGALRRVPGPAGDSIWEREWDVLLILDACRWDVFSENYGDADWLETVEPITSVGSASPEWMDKTFTTEYKDKLASTAYVTGNPYSEDHVTENQLALLDEVWRYVWDDDLGTIPPEPLTNQAVKHWRTGDYERMIVHYMQPHWPYVTNPIEGGFNPRTVINNEKAENAFDLQNRGEISKSDHIAAYSDNLEYIIDHIHRTLLQAITADQVAITSDHGEAFGEFGIYEHPSRVPIPVLRKVPWAITSGRDTGEYNIDDLRSDTEIGATREKKLRDLGYL
ncbi:hypothetical protein SAMN04488065_2894 [Haloplanus vescus]|uniref:Sulfatase n=1 Tax=Haloplanus vescus TaxID=555874 RepID=A0A1H4AQH1_9EURY|nr:hypothetical protein [Haloplanus vescus]SEA38091.1 hypothetical protein SAMN04488065_2894 [Haloplanus vescus]